MGQRYHDKSTVVRATGGSFIPGFDPPSADALHSILADASSGPDPYGEASLRLPEETGRHRRLGARRLIMDSRWS